MSSSNINISKQGVLTVKDKIKENKVVTGYNLLSINGLSGYNGGSISSMAADGKYTVTSPVSSSSWGTGFQITNGNIILPYDCIYRVYMEVYVPSAHKIQVDINNTVPSGATIQGGNDNDSGSDRTPTSFSIPATTWTQIYWGGKNKDASNTTQADLSVYDGAGLITSADSATITWYIRNPRIYIGFNEKDILGISKENLYSNFIYEY